MSYLNIRDLSFAVKNQNENKQILHNLNLTVEQGSFTVILGGNGAGKSTLFNLLDGTYPPTTGSIALNGQEIRRLPLKEQAQKIARVFQDPKFGTAPRMTVLENLMLAENKGKTSLFHFVAPKSVAAKYKTLLAKSQNGLEERLNQATDTLSGGQRQALSLFMATLQTPELLLLDEHTAALDPKSATNIMALTDELVRQEKLTCLMITHNLQDALTYGDQLVVLKDGQVAATFDAEAKEKLTKEELFPYFL